MQLRRSLCSDSEGIMAISNIVAVENEIRQIEDVLAIFYPNHKISGVPECYSALYRSPSGN